MPWRWSSARPSSLASRSARWRSKRWPATAAASTAARASSESGEALISTASRTVSGAGTSSSPPRSRPRGPACRRPLTTSARASSSTKNGRPCVRSWIATARAGEGRSGRRLASSSAVSPRSSGASASSCSPLPRRSSAQLVVAREPVGAVRAEQHQRQLVELRREAGEQLERRLVGPLEVVEHDERGLADLGPRGADRFEDRRAITRRRLLAQLGEQQWEVRAERPQPREGAGLEAQVRAGRRRQDRRGRRRCSSPRRAARARRRRRRPRRRGASSRRRPRPRGAAACPCRGAPARRPGPARRAGRRGRGPRQPLGSSSRPGSGRAARSRCPRPG